MLKRLKIRNFRSVVDAESEPLEFGRINLFVGPNGGGKSNALEAIGIISAALKRGISPRDLDDRGVRLSLPKMFKATFRKRRIPREFYLEAETENCTYACSVLAGDQDETLNIQTERLEVNGKRLFGRNLGGGMKSSVSDPLLDQAVARAAPEPTRSMFDVIKAFLPLSEAARFELDALSDYSIYAPQTAVLRGQAEDKRQTHPLGLTGGRLPSALKEITAHAKTLSPEERRKYTTGVYHIAAMCGWIDLISTGERNPLIVPSDVPTLSDAVYFHDKFMRPERSWLSAYDASEGALYLLFVSVLLHHPDSPPIFALDNVDGTLNPGMVRSLVRTIRDTVAADKSKQVFMTSHNPTALDELDLFNPDHRVYVVYRGGNGHTKFYPLRPNEGMTRKEWEKTYSSRNLSSLWVDGDIPHAMPERG